MMANDKDWPDAKKEMKPELQKRLGKTANLRKEFIQKALQGMKKKLQAVLDAHWRGLSRQMHLKAKFTFFDIFRHFYVFQFYYFRVHVGQTQNCT